MQQKVKDTPDINSFPQRTHIVSCQIYTKNLEGFGLLLRPCPVLGCKLCLLQVFPKSDYATPWLYCRLSVCSRYISNALTPSSALFDSDIGGETGEELRVRPVACLIQDGFVLSNDRQHDMNRAKFA